MNHTPLWRINSVPRFAHLFVKDESTWPSGTFKDRLSLRAIARCRARATTFATLSYGNTGISIARYAREAAVAGGRHHVVIVVPRDFECWEFGPSSLGTKLPAREVLEELQGFATVVPLDLSYDVLDDGALRKVAIEAGVPCSRFVNITEGLDVPVYVDIIREAVEQLGRPPDICVVPYGAGILCNEISDYLSNLGHGRVVPVSVASPKSMARMLYGPIWLDTVTLESQGVASSRHRSPDRTGAIRRPYRVWRVDESEILRGIEIAREERLSAEPSGAAGLGVLHRLEEIVPGVRPQHDMVLVINTGNGIDGLRRSGARA